MSAAPASRPKRQRPESQVIDLTGDDHPTPPRARRRQPASFSCAVCLSDGVPRADGRLLFCGHTYCRACAAGLVAAAVDSGLPDAEGVRCPELSCRRPLTGADVDACAPNKDTAARFHALAFDRLVARSKDDGMSCCPSPGCPFVFVWDKDHRKLECPLCSKRYCLVCQCAWHQGIRCEIKKSNADDGGMAALAKKGKFKCCPSCGACSFHSP